MVLLPSLSFSAPPFPFSNPRIRVWAPPREMSAEDGDKTAEEQPPSGELLFCGGTGWDTMGRKPGGQNLLSPNRLLPLVGVDVRFVASGCTSCHCVALDAEGRCYTWGRNEKGQLGHGVVDNCSLPMVVTGLSKYRIVKAGAGKNHTVVVTDDGKSFAFGLNKHGQLGCGSTKNEIESSPILCQVSEATNVMCGADFTVWLSSVEGSTILTAGLPQYGQLGHGTDNEFNVKESSVKLAYEPQSRPRAIAAFSGKTVVKAACGTNHTVAVDSSGFVYTWGFGGYGRLGHREQKDEWAPRLVEVFQRQNILPPNAVVSAGSANSACTAGGGQLYMWGKLKNTGDDWMYPKPVLDLSGWNIRCMDSGGMHHVVGADDSCISWGQAQFGELGYGPLGQKSSAKPKKIDVLDGLHVTSVACGLGFSMIVVDRAKSGDKLNELEIYDGEVPQEEEEEIPSNTAIYKRTPKKAAVDSVAKNSKKRKKDEESSESEDFENGSEDDDEVSRGTRGGHGRCGRGRGRGAKSGSGRGRGRPRSSPKDLDQPEAGKTSSTPRRRGRPPKSGGVGR